MSGTNVIIRLAIEEQQKFLSLLQSENGGEDIILRRVSTWRSAEVTYADVLVTIVSATSLTALATIIKSYLARNHGKIEIISEKNGIKTIFEGPLDKLPLDQLLILLESQALSGTKNSNQELDPSSLQVANSEGIASVKLVEKQSYESDRQQHNSYKQMPCLKLKRPEVVKILFLAANPSDTTRLRLDTEIRDIDQALRQAEFRDKFDLKQHWAVRVTDLQSYFLRHKPDVVHFSGHGSASSEILLEEGCGSSSPVSVRALSQLFSVLKDNIRCVVLNACYSEQQAQAIAEQIDCVIGMSKSIGDSSAISFAMAFYQALGYGRDIKTAFDLGCVQIDLENLNEQDIPKLLAKKCNPKDIVLVDTE